MRLLYIRKHSIAIASHHHFDTHSLKFNADVTGDLREDVAKPRDAERRPS